MLFLKASNCSTSMASHTLMCRYGSDSSATPEGRRRGYTSENYDVYFNHEWRLLVDYSQKTGLLPIMVYAEITNPVALFRNSTIPPFCFCTRNNCNEDFVTCASGLHVDYSLKPGMNMTASCTMSRTSMGTMTMSSSIRPSNTSTNAVSILPVSTVATYTVKRREWSS